MSENAINRLITAITKFSNLVYRANRPHGMAPGEELKSSSAGQERLARHRATFRRDIVDTHTDILNLAHENSWKNLVRDTAEAETGIYPVAGWAEEGLELGRRQASIPRTYKVGISDAETREEEAGLDEGRQRVATIRLNEPRTVVIGEPEIDEWQRQGQAIISKLNRITLLSPEPQETRKVKGNKSTAATIKPLIGQALKAAEYIRKRPGKTGPVISDDTKINYDRFRAIFRSKLKPLGFYNAGGYFPPPSS